MAKRVVELYDEIEAHESTLRRFDHRVLRCLEVVKLVVRQPGRPKHHLVCVRQTMANGACRGACARELRVAASVGSGLPTSRGVRLRGVRLRGVRSRAACVLRAGRTRMRPDLMPSEKLFHGEDVMACAERCVLEELSIADRERIEVDAASHIAWVEMVEWVAPRARTHARPIARNRVLRGWAPPHSCCAAARLLFPS